MTLYTRRPPRGPHVARAITDDLGDRATYRWCGHCERWLTEDAFDRRRRLCRACVARIPTACAICEGPLPPWMTGRPRSVCDRPSCVSEARAHGARHATRSREAAKVQAVPLHRTCARCGDVKPAGLLHWTVDRRNADGSVARFHPWCRDCKRAYQRERYQSPEQGEAKRQASRELYARRKAEDPEGLRDEWRRARPRKNPEKARAAAKRYRQRQKKRMMDDPALHAEALEKRRMEYRLRRERRGLPVRPAGLSIGLDGFLPVDPARGWLMEALVDRGYVFTESMARFLPPSLRARAVTVSLRQTTGDAAALAALCSLPERRIYGILARQVDFVALDTVDRLLVGLDAVHLLHVLYPGLDDGSLPLSKPQEGARPLRALAGAK